MTGSDKAKQRTASELEDHEHEAADGLTDRVQPGDPQGSSRVQSVGELIRERFGMGTR